MQDAVRANGIDRGPRADLFTWGGKIGGSGIGLHIGSALGGIMIDAAAINEGIVLVNTHEILLGSQVV
jgi:hypothetical protein